MICPKYSEICTESVGGSLDIFPQYFYNPGSPVCGPRTSACLVLLVMQPCVHIFPLTLLWSACAKENQTQTFSGDICTSGSFSGKWLFKLHVLDETMHRGRVVWLHRGLRPQRWWPLFNTRLCSELVRYIWLWWGMRYKRLQSGETHNYCKCTL